MSKRFFFSPLNADRGNNLQGKTKAEYWQKLSIKKLQQKVTELKTGFARLNSSQASDMLKSAAVNVRLKLVVIDLKKLAAAGSSQK